MTKATDYLIAGKNVGKTKTDAAVKKGVTVVSISAVMHLLFRRPSLTTRPWLGLVG